MDKKNWTYCKHVPCNTRTHSTNEDLLNIKRKGDHRSRTLSRTFDTTETRNPCVIASIARSKLNSNMCVRRLINILTIPTGSGF